MGLGAAACVAGHLAAPLAGLHVRTASSAVHGQLPSSFAGGPGAPAAHGAKVPVPPCVDGDGDCDTKEDFQQLRTFSKAVDESMQEPLQRAEQARKRFERRVCDYQYSQVQDQSPLLTDTYGPTGPMLPGGSYLYELRMWSDAIHAIYRACAKSQTCQSLVGFLQQHPDADTYGEGFHGKAGSKLYNELREACQVGKTRSPVPNDSPVWCDTATGLCEQKSCRQWWRAAHGGRPHPKPWVDDREEYDDLRDACSWITEERYKPGEIDEYQRRLDVEQQQRREQFCSPRWVEGYCAGGREKARFAECVLHTGQRCSNGRVLPGSDKDATAGWFEPFKEPPVEMSTMARSAPLLLVRAVASPRPSTLDPSRRAASEMRDFL